MLKIMQYLTIALLLLAGAAIAQPTHIQLEYSVSRNGDDFGTVKEQYVQEGNQYRIESTTKGKGIYALLGERVLTSKGKVTSAGLVPDEFKLKRGDNKRKSLTANFDWVKKKLNMLVKGETRTADLKTGTVDLASYAYQFMFTPPKGKQVSMTLTSGKRLKQYDYNIVSTTEAIKTGAGDYQTTHLVSAKVDGKKKKELWLAGAQHYIPVKYVVVDKHGDKIEQTLTKISIQ